MVRLLESVCRNPEKNVQKSDLGLSLYLPDCFSTLKCCVLVVSVGSYI